MRRQSTEISHFFYFFLINFSILTIVTVQRVIRGVAIYIFIISFAVKISAFCKIFSFKSKRFKILGAKIIFMSLISGKFFIISKVRQKFTTSHRKYIAVGWVIACDKAIFVNVRAPEFINFTPFKITIHHKF